MPRVSVIVPNYNHGRFLDARLGSILRQTFTDFELIFLDDASTDNSRAVFEKYAADQRIRSRFNSVNSGSPFIQWNRGIAMASGDYLWIAESDDFCDERFLEVLVGRLDDNPKAALAYSQSWICSESGAKEKVLDWYHVFGGGKRWSRGFSNSGYDEIVRFLAIQNTIPNASAVLMRKSFMDSGQPAPEQMKLCGDWMFWINALVLGDVEFVSEPLNCFRQVSSTSQRKITARLGLEVLESFEIQRKVMNEIQPGRRYIRRMLNHHLRRWASLSYHEALSGDFDASVYARFVELYDQCASLNPLDRARIRLYYRFVIPAMKNGVYRSTLGRLRTAHLKRRGIL